MAGLFGPSVIPDTHMVWTLAEDPPVKLTPIVRALYVLASLVLTAAGVAAGFLAAWH